MSKINVRNGIFETNSSAMHAITMCSDSDYNLWKSGKLVYDYCKHELLTLEEVNKQIEDEKAYLDELEKRTKDDKNSLLLSIEKITLPVELGGTFHRYFTFDEFNSDIMYEDTYDESYTTESGEVVHAFGYYGRN